tara:strand:- start:267 stop:584 length:318 start_codon:yes stop_codon:yes gene_type:complete
MVKKIMKKNGKYHVNGKTYKQLRGSRVAVWNENAYKTSGGLTKNMLVKNKHGRYVSKKKHHSAKKEKRLQKYGYYAKKGKFGYVFKGNKKSLKKKRKTRRKTSKK